MSTVMEADMERLKYPRGPLALAADPSADRIHAWIDAIEALPPQLRAAVAGLNDQQLDTPYRPGGWTVRMLVHHLPESHVNAFIRTQLVLTEERPTIRPYDQDAWCALPYARTAAVDVSLDLLEATHRRWVPVLRSLSPDQWNRPYFHPEDQQWFALSDLLQIYAWHSGHHLAHITELRARLGWD